MKIFKHTRLQFNDAELKEIIKEHCSKKGYNVSVDNVTFNCSNIKSGFLSDRSFECIVHCEYERSEENQFPKDLQPDPSASIVHETFANKEE